MTKHSLHAASVSYDVLVVGGGPCGLAAAIALGRCGVRVLLVRSTRRPASTPAGT